MNTLSQTLGRRSDDNDVLFAFAWADLLMRPFDAVYVLVKIRLVTALTHLQDARADVWEDVPFASSTAAPEPTSDELPP